MIRTTMKRLLAILLSALAFSSCSTKEDFTFDPYRNYDALWEILDRGYCFFDLKLPEDSTWRDMYHKHYRDLRPQMSSDSLFLVMTQLLSELKDGHVNLSSSFDYGHYWKWYEDYPLNLSLDLRRKYLGHDYRIAGGLKYRRLTYNGHAPDSIGYIVYESFGKPISNSNISGMLSRLTECKALIIDIRGNGGGQLTYADEFARHFTKEKMLTGYIRHKTGPAHDAFSDPLPLYLDTLSSGVVWMRPVVLLTNREVFSSANDFVLKMRSLPFVTVMGDKTGGGAGLPISSEIPCGWGVRYSAGRMTDPSGADVEFGIEPHYYVSLLDSDLANSHDTLIEEAVRYIKRKIAEYNQNGQWIK
ncbi:S41 family peptidase [Porphyromonas gingivalis]|uniref:S41 family peptidase n=1 Tax=Porphyromonas gingivalis TaxID=837 RepID=UPI0009D6584F|nr:S41 family peptidase [Porphyromonas gingivalis]ATR93064.1 peptidase S41 [Porphyromonas gingivalis]ATS08067.1 peptidase S41 [Porphyromonas gingivalis]ATS11099.1 peptidase S41 [Porphyromonas gingivalis]RZQ67372.1 peptidase S41 [Porphyromonas gingivalis]